VGRKADENRRMSDIKSSETEERGFHTISLPLNRPLNVVEVHIVDAIEKKCKRDHISFTRTDELLHFHYHTLDFDLFKAHVPQVLSEYRNRFPTAEIDDVLFTTLVSELESIKSYGIKAGKRVYVDYNKERKVRGRPKKVAQRVSYFYAADNTFTQEVNTLPPECTNKILCGDSVEVLKGIPSNSVDLVFTSPPYNFGLDYQKSEDGILWDEYFEKLFTVFSECIRVVKYGGRIIVNVQPLFSDYIPIHHIISNFFMENHLIWKGEILWEKNNYNCKYTAWGSWKSPSNPYLKYTWEFVEIFCKGGLKKTGDKADADITADEFKKWVVARWSIGPERAMKKYGHPAMFPEDLVERVLKLFSFKNDIILDPFNGVGTTCAVAKRLERRYIGIDISEEYCKKAEARLKSTQIQKQLDLA
jgi:DNA modification methylase